MVPARHAAGPLHNAGQSAGKRPAPIAIAEKKGRYRQPTIRGSSFRNSSRARTVSAEGRLFSLLAHRTAAYQERLDRLTRLRSSVSGRRSVGAWSREDPRSAGCATGLRSAAAPLPSRRGRAELRGGITDRLKNAAASRVTRSVSEGKHCAAATRRVPLTLRVRLKRHSMILQEPDRTPYDLRFHSSASTSASIRCFGSSASHLGAKEPKVALVAVAAMFLSILIHEFGHVWAFKRIRNLLAHCAARLRRTGDSDGMRGIYGTGRRLFPSRLGLRRFCRPGIGDGGGIAHRRRRETERRLGRYRFRRNLGP